MAYLIVLGVSCLILCSQTLGVEFDYVGQEDEWKSGLATWYGASVGDGSEGGACGYGSLVAQPPFASNIAAVGPGILNGGKGCGECYQVKCAMSNLCSQTPVSVVVTDSCPECKEANAHFDLSGSAFSSMAFPPESADLRNAGRINIMYKRVPCHYPGKNIEFHVNAGATNYWFSVLIVYENGDGDLGAVYLKQANSNTWQAMQQTWGANWALSNGPLRGPFSIRVQSLSTGKTVTANQVIPQNWQASGAYRSLVNFD